jgi:hypothetical protein
MKKNLLFCIFFLGACLSLHAQEGISKFITSGNENYAIINISRSYTFQEWNTGSAKLILMVYINDQPFCEIPSQSRASIKVFSTGKLKISVKYLPNKKYKEKTINKCFHSGPPLEMDVSQGKTYFTNIDMKDQSKLQVNVTAQLVSIPESEGMFKDEARFKKNPVVKEFQEDKSNPFIKTN